MFHITDHYTDPADHLALDEAMLLEADSGSLEGGMRVWQLTRPCVIAGRATRVDDEIDRDFCRESAIPILRRCSGGASVVGGPGCLMYSLVLSLGDADGLRKVDVAHRHVMTRVLQALQRQLPECRLQGICDLTWNNRKCSGNALRITRRHLLYHGTILHGFDLPLISRCLREAPRQPEYRKGRDHSQFLTNVPIDPQKFAADLLQTFGADQRLDARRLSDRAGQLRSQRYDSDSWNFRH